MARKIKDKSKRPLKYDGKTPKSPRASNYHDNDGRFKAGNPGKPEGAISARTRLQNLLMSAFGPKEAKVFTLFFKKANGNYLRALDRLIELMNSKGGTGDGGPLGLPPFQVLLEGMEGNNVTESLAPEEESE